MEGLDVMAEVDHHEPLAETDPRRAMFVDCWERALYAFATGTIFLQRSRFYRQGLQALTAVAVIVPLFIGGYVLAYGTDGGRLKRLIPLAAALGVVQLVLSGYSLVYGWPEKLEYALTSVADNLDLSAQFKELGSMAINPPADLDVRYAALKAKDDARRRDDATKGVTPAEFRYGHRAGLRQFGRVCKSCKTEPVSMAPTECEQCGRFPRRWR
jgi:mobilome CxxCx(11)CxxC protein